jgi:hypothetical protein
MAITSSYSNVGATATVGNVAVPVPAVATIDQLGSVVTPGGSATVAIAAGHTANTVVSASPGRLCRVLITTAGTATTVSIFDNATTNSGTIIGIFPGTATAGTVFDFEMPAVNGITVGGASTNPAMTISYY